MYQPLQEALPFLQQMHPLVHLSQHTAASALMQASLKMTMGPLLKMMKGQEV
jgi:hypothetical protein